MQSTLASVSNINGNSKSGRDSILSMFVSSVLSVSSASLASSVRSTSLSVLFRCLFSGDPIFANPLMNFRRIYSLLIELQLFVTILFGVVS